MRDKDLDTVKSAFRRLGVTTLLAKRLAENDNSKNQIYLGGSFEVLNLIPFSDSRVVRSSKGRAVIHATVSLSWLRENGTTTPAPNTKLILYPQYPEVRLSGFLLGAAGAPSELLTATARIAGRVLLLGVRPDRTIVGCVFSPDDIVAMQLTAVGAFDAGNVLARIPLDDDAARRDRLLLALREIAEREWIDSFRLDSAGLRRPCNALNCGGLTLEGMLGIRPNSRSEPDFEGYEVKQFRVKDFTKFQAASLITLFTPEPTIGLYADAGVEAFVRRYGYPDQRGREDRLNFGGRFTVGRRLERTGLTLVLTGADRETGKIDEADGSISLVDDEGNVAAGWPFAALIEHWNRKHAEAAYVPSMKLADPLRFRYADTIFLGYGTDFGRFMRGLAEGVVCYDPGIKLEEVGSGAPKAHKRSQFRVGFAELEMLYERFEGVVLV